MLEKINSFILLFKIIEYGWESPFLQTSGHISQTMEPGLLFWTNEKILAAPSFDLSKPWVLIVAHKKQVFLDILYLRANNMIGLVFLHKTKKNLLDKHKHTVPSYYLKRRYSETIENLLFEKSSVSSTILRMLEIFFQNAFAVSFYRNPLIFFTPALFYFLVITLLLLVSSKYQADQQEQKQIKIELEEKTRPATTLDFNNECMICLENFQHTEKCVELQCNHIYHLNCLIQWTPYSTQCPICRKSYVSGIKKIHTF